MHAALLAAVLLTVPTLQQVRDQNFQVTAIDGKQVALNDLLPEGKPVVVEFWATWCVPCRKSIPHLVELSKGIAVVGLTVDHADTDREKVEKMAAQFGITYPIAFASHEVFRFMNRRQQIGVPKLLIYDAEGKAVEHILSYSLFTNRRIDGAVGRLIAK